MTGSSAFIHIRNARENNLKSISLNIPHGKLIAVTGISGSGKSSLAFDTIAAEGSRQYLETIPSFVRQFFGQISKPDADEIQGLHPVISIGQKPPGRSSRSTLGTVSEIYDYLRLLFARFGESERQVKLSRSLFSFNSPEGACPKCSGLGLEEKISIDKLVSDPSRSLREGALAPTLPSGYIMYSQLTIDVLDTVCREHGFSVDIPWNKLDEDQRNVVLYGSNKIEVLKGKHTIESRLRWKALKAKPREYGYYTGIINVMEDILRRDRNRNILRFAESVSCSACNGNRLNQKALSVKYRDFTIDYLCKLELSELLGTISAIETGARAEKDICKKIISQLELLCMLGAGHLHLSRSTDSLSGGELQRVRLVNQLSASLTNVLYILDEPSIGMHSRDVNSLISILRRLVGQGNTVIIVEHDPGIIRNCDWIIETGPGAGIKGGEILFNGPVDEFMHNTKMTPTQYALSITHGHEEPGPEGEMFRLDNCSENNLKGISVSFQKAAVNVITGVPGAGKSSLVFGCLEPELEKAIRIDRSPIGRTPRSNPATYTGLADHIRDLFAEQESAIEKGYTKGRFSFNNRGGRCEKCEGAGKIQVGMHYLGKIDVVCEVCKGRRFNDETLEIKYKGKSISDIYDLSINQAAEFLGDEHRILGYLTVLQSLGIGYLKLGQSSTTLSGGEAQRIKLAAALSRKFSSGTWIIMDEPTTGLHYMDTEVLIKALKRLTANGNTIVAIEYQEQFIRVADRIVDLGPGSGRKGGNKVFEGTWNDFLKCKESVTVEYLNKAGSPEKHKPYKHRHISIKGCKTNNLRNIDIDIPLNSINVITGISGSGKSSLAFDTVYSEAQSRFTESMSVFSRSYIKQSNPAKAESFSNLTPVVAVNRKNLPLSPRSTLGTMTGIYEKYRYLFSRIAQLGELNMSARNFSFNHESGACTHCSGLGVVLKAEPDKLVKDWKMSVAGGALTGNSTIKYYGNPDSQFVAILKEAGKSCGLDIHQALEDYNDKQLDLLFKGTGDKIWNTVWNFKSRKSEGFKEISGVWKGFSGLVEEEYHRRLHNKNLAGIRSLLYEEECPVCQGARLNLKALSVRINNVNIAELSGLSVDETRSWFLEVRKGNSTISLIINSIYEAIRPLLHHMQMLGLGHIAINRRSSTLSGGEGQRLRLARQLSGALTGITFILDEPTVGLHRRDVVRLMKVITDLKNKGNTLIIVEQDREVIKSAENIIELGPGSGKEGGCIVEQGPYQHFIKSDKAITPGYLKENYLPRPLKRNIRKDAFGLKNVNKHNLVKRSFSFSSGGIIAVTGVSGAGKSTLVHHVLAPSLKRNKAVNCDSFFNREEFDQYIVIDHRAAKGNIFSTVASYTGLIDSFISFFADTEAAKQQSIKKSTFSYNSKEGRCPVCKGAGKLRISMDFMDDVWNVCYSCKGSRYNDRVLNIKHKGLNVTDLMQLTVNELITYFGDIQGKRSEAIMNILVQLKETGLGHLQSGQELESLSAGEGQRISLSVKLLEGRGEKTLYMLDEPTTGLYYPDIDKLIKVFNRLVDEGHTVLFIEHNPYLIAVANQVVEL
ncbi:MAG: ATP-binding cassette domain-containing protein [Bacteroidales bacterium]